MKGPKILIIDSIVLIHLYAILIVRQHKFTK